MSPAPVRRALIVVAMHRSGTSALTRTINLLGAALPSELEQIDPTNLHETNVLGLWEGQRVKLLNDEFLATIGSGWNDTAQIPSAVFRSDAAVAMRDRIVRHLEAEFSASPLFVIKDPRIARLVPLWTDALKAFGAEPNFILSVRNPLEVAQSLLKRDQMGRGQATLLWLRYMLDAERDTRNYRRSFIAYDALLENWRRVVRRIAEDCGFEWPRFNAGSELEIDSFLSSERRHNVATPDQLSELPEWMRTAYGLFQQAARGDCCDIAEMERISEEFSRADLAFDRYIRELDQAMRLNYSKAWQLGGALKEEQTRTAELSRQVEVFPGIRQLLEAQLAERSEALSEAIAAQKAATFRVVELEQTVQLDEAQFAKLQAELDRKLGDFDQIVAELATTRAQLDDLDRAKTEERVGLEAAVARRDSELAEMTAALERAQSQFEDFDQAKAEERAALEAALAGRDGELAQMTAALERARTQFEDFDRAQATERAALEAAVARRDSELAEMTAALERAQSQFEDFDQAKAEERAALEAALADRDGELAQMSAELERARTQFEDFDRAQATERAALEAAVARRDSELAEMTAALERAQSQFEDFDQAKAEERAALEAALARRDDELVEIMAELQTARIEFDELDQTSRETQVILTRQLGDMRAERDRLQTELDERGRVVASLQSSLAEMEGAVQTLPVLRRRLDELNSQSDRNGDRLARTLEELDAARIQLEINKDSSQLANSSLAVARAALSASNKKLKTIRAEFEASLIELLATRNELDTARQSLELCRTHADAVDQTLRATISDMEGARIELAAARRELDGSRQALDSSRTDLDAIAAERDQLRAELAAIRGSRSWRLTKPLRRLVSQLQARQFGPSS